jgi:hypothetical protein
MRLSTWVVALCVGLFESCLTVSIPVRVANDHLG